MQHGLVSWSMHSIAEEAGVAVKTLYNLFGSKDELVLKAGTQALSTLESSDAMADIEAGIPRLLAYVVATMEDFISAPKYADAVISTLAKADLEVQLADHHMGVVRRFAETSLKIAEQQGELRPGVDITRLATHISADQWGAVLLWVKGLLDVQALPDHVALSHYMVLMPHTTGPRHQAMEKEYKTLLAKSGLVASAIKST